MSFFENVSADSKQIGFDYQDLVCLEYLIEMKQGETVGLEVLDDVHQERIDGSNYLIQVKHSISDKGTLTNSDIDFWKTISNWIKASIELKGKSLKFIFYTNKKPTFEAGIIQELISKPLKFDKALDYVSKLKSKLDAAELEKEKGSSTNPIKKYVEHINSCTEIELINVLKHIDFVFDYDEIISRLRSKLEYLAIPVVA